MNNSNDFYNSLFEGIDESFLNSFANLTKNLIGSPTVIQKNFSPNSFLKTYLTLATNLNDKSIDVLMYLLNHSNDEGVYVGTYDTIINDLQISRNTLANIMTDLQAKNLVTKVKDGWQVSSSVNIPANGQNIVIQFNKTPTKPVEKKKPEFDFENFDNFIPEYLSSFNRVIPEDAKTFNNEKIIEDIKQLKEEYTKYLEKTKKVGFKKTEYVICKKDGEGYVLRSIAQKWTRFCKKNKIRVIRFHDLRHTCATLMIAGGVSPATVQAILGHSDVQITLNTYTHPLPTMLQSASNIMNNLLI